MTGATTGPEGRPSRPAPRAAGGEDNPFHVSPLLDVLGGLLHRQPDFWLWLGRLESRLLAEEVRRVSVRMPIYVCGLARSGSTLLHEVVSSHPGVATHRMK